MDQTGNAMHLRVLGCSGGIGKGLRTSSFLVDDDILIDAGTGVCDLESEEMRRIRHIFVTHSHLDHVVSVPMLVDSLFSCLEEPLVVHALPETIEAMRTHLFNWTIWPDFSELPDSDHAVLRFEPMAPGDRVRLGERTVEMVAVNHAVPAAGYICVDSGGGAFCFSGDTGPSETLWTALNRLESLDILLIETGFSDEDTDLAELAGHYTPASLARDLDRLEHRPLIGISHLKTGIEEITMKQIEAQIEGFELRALQAGDTFTL